MNNWKAEIFNTTMYILRKYLPENYLKILQEMWVLCLISETQNFVVIYQLESYNGVSIIKHAIFIYKFSVFFGPINKSN